MFGLVKFCARPDLYMSEIDFRTCKTMHAQTVYANHGATYVLQLPAHPTPNPGNATIIIYSKLRPCPVDLFSNEFIMSSISSLDI